MFFFEIKKIYMCENNLKIMVCGNLSTMLKSLIRKCTECLKYM